MEQNKNQHHDHAHHQDHARRDDLTWTQYITNLAANRLAPPKSQTLKVLEDHLFRLNEELAGGGTGAGRIRDRISGDGGDESESITSANPKTEDRDFEKLSSSSKDGLTASPNDILALNSDNGIVSGASSLAMATSVASQVVDIDKVSFSSGARFGRPASQVQLLNQSLSQGSRWIDVLWQFIAAHQKRIVDLERLGIEPNERMDLQVEMIRQIAATYEKLGLLTRAPDSLSEARECKIVDDVRTMALVYVARKMMDVASPDEIAGSNDHNDNEKRRQIIEFPRSVVSPYEGIRPIDFDPLELIMAV